jgi:hypothetical protein
LDEIFNAGHFLAYTHGPIRHVARAPDASNETGPWAISADAVDAVGYRKTVTTEDLEGDLSDTDQEATGWKVDDDHCWCEECASTRKMLETQTSD